MSSRNVIIVVAVIVVLAIIGWQLGWFGGAEVVEPAPPATTTN
ncbi:MAG: hypothetical protein R3D28_23790 [Geminicoccaceae bacterium]|jgi:hypothetical protein|nr:hypothetical protein [Geminicoccaceae bacterium]